MGYLEAFRVLDRGAGGADPLREPQGHGDANHSLPAWLIGRRVQGSLRASELVVFVGPLEV